MSAGSKIYPPHLPTPASSVKGKKIRQTSWYFFSLILVAFLSGSLSGLLSVGWFFPRFSLGEELVSLRALRGDQTEQDKFDVSTISRTFLVYENLNPDNDSRPIKIFDPLGRAVLISSNGYAVLPRVLDGQPADFVGILPGSGARVAVVDMDVLPEFGITILKIAGDGFRVAAFAGEHTSNQTLFSLGSSEVSAMIGLRGTFSFSEEFSLLQPFRLAYFPKSEENSLVFTSGGALYGFAFGDGSLVEFKFLENYISGRLSGERILFDDSLPQILGRTVSFFSKKDKDDEEVERKGFLVESVPRSVATKVRVGDIIVSVDGEPYPFSRSQGWFVDGQSRVFEVLLWRDGQEILLEI